MKLMINVGEKTKWMGTWNIKVLDKNTKEILEEIEIQNRIMDAALDELAEVFLGTAPDLQVEYLGLGTSNTPLTNTQTMLVSEIFRAPYISQDKTGVGEITTTFYVIDIEAVAQIEEIGIFAGSGATVTKDSGKMISRILWSRNKTSNEEIHFTRKDSLSRG
jgi:hypothetical protein